MAARLRVLVLIDDVTRTGGGETLAKELVVRLDPSRFDRILCSSRWTQREASAPGAQEAIGTLAEAGVRFIGLRRRSALQLWAWRPLVDVMRREGVDILHTHLFGSNLWGAALSTVLRVPVFVAHEHTWSFEGHHLRRFLDREVIARRADAYVAVSEADRRKMIEIERIDAGKVVLIPNGLPEGSWPTGRDVRAELGIPADAPVVGTVCSLRAQKALHVLLEAAAVLRRDKPALRVLIAGDGPERQRLEALVGQLALDECVTLLGDRADAADVIEAFDVAACSSDFEGMPLSIMEYMQAAKPVVSTRVGGVPELIRDGVDGLLVGPGDPAALAGAIARLLSDPDLAASMGESGRERRRREFDIDTMVRRIERLYEELYLESSRPGGREKG